MALGTATADIALAKGVYLADRREAVRSVPSLPVSGGQDRARAPPAARMLSGRRPQALSPTRRAAAAAEHLGAPPRGCGGGLTFRTPPKPCSAATRSASAWSPPCSSTKKWLV